MKTQKEDIPTELEQVSYVIFSSTIIQQHQPALISAFYISRAWILFCIRFIDFSSQPSGASVKTNKSLQLADGSWLVSVVSAHVKITNMYSQRFSALYPCLLKENYNQTLTVPATEAFFYYYYSKVKTII